MNKIFNGNCLEVLKTLPENSVDAVVTDPPAGISFMGKDWDNMGDLNGFQEFIKNVFIEIKRVLKPGGHCLVWAIPRTSHHTAMGIERAGFEIRDCVYHIFGSGFPKSLNIGKAVDKIQGNKREAIGRNPNSRENCDKSNTLYESGTVGKTDILTKGTSEWEGCGTALKPAVECWWLCRKPISEKTVAENCLKWGTGGINIDECRVEMSQSDNDMLEAKSSKEFVGVKPFGNTKIKGSALKPNQLGRFPANLIHSGEKEVVDLFPNSKAGKNKKEKGKGGIFKKGTNLPIGQEYGDNGSAARFFYCSKASKSERNKGCEELEIKQSRGGGGQGKDDPDLEKVAHAYGSIKAPARNFHPTVKPIKLMEYLVKLVSRENAIVLDPFTGSGSTGVACKNLNRQFIGCELSPEYCEIAKVRTGFEVIKVDSKEIPQIKIENKVEVNWKIKEIGMLSKCCNAKIKKGYCEACCEKVIKV